MHSKYYNEKQFAIDMIMDAYGIDNPEEIVKKCKSDLDIKVTTSHVLDYINYTEDFEKKSWTISSREIFN